MLGVAFLEPLALLSALFLPESLELGEVFFSVLFFPLVMVFFLPGEAGELPVEGVAFFLPCYLVIINISNIHFTHS